tara:strand:+ start:6358 stop:7911 length:1554 start_codon:yes stop_codon:yes gene_type:complete
MASYRYLILFPLFLVLSCAQIGTITGGVNDIIAPRPIMNKVEPRNETTNFKAQEIKIPFNEFIKLKDASKNIRIVPPHATINSSIKGKVLTLSWDDTLQKNTTYAIYLNNAVQDITEANDTLIQYVFSTGSTIDSLTYSVKIVDAENNTPIKKCILALHDVNSNELQSFAESDINGNVVLRYLPSKSFKMIAFLDENRDLMLQKHEKCGFKGNQIVEVNQHKKDSIPIRLFQPVLPAKITTAKYISNGTFTIGATTKISDAQFYIDGSMVNPEKIRILASDSVLLFHDTRDKNDLQLIVSTPKVIDTNKIRFNDYQKKRPVTLRPFNSNNTFSPSETVSFSCTDYIESVDSSLITVLNKEDSTIISNYSVSFKYNQVFFEVNKEKVNSLSITFNNNAIITTHGSTKLHVYDVKLLPIRSFGSIKVQLENYSSPIILQLFKNGEVQEERVLDSSINSILFEELEPDSYSFRIIEESTVNGRWDVGDIESHTQPETIYYYSKVIKVRANWEVEVELIKD